MIEWQPLLKTLISTTLSRKTIMPIFLTALTMIAGSFIVSAYSSISEKINIIPTWAYGILIFCFYFLLIDKMDSNRKIKDKAKEEKVEKEKEIKKKKQILKKLEELRNIEQLEKGFESQRDCLNWANKVAPLLKQVSMQNYVNFMPFAQKLNADGISGTIPKSFLNTMVSNLDQAINELKANT